MVRRFGIARKLLAVCLAFSLPIAVMLILMTRAKLEEIDFAEKEIIGDAFQRPLEDALEHISFHRRLWVRQSQGDDSARARLAEEAAAVDRALVDIEAADRAHGEELQFTPEGLGLRNRTEFTASGLRRKWTKLTADLAALPAADGALAYEAVIRHVRTMITHAGDVSNLILDPDLDSYYLMDVTLLTLPQMEDRVQAIAVDVEQKVAAGSLSPADRLHFATVAAFLSEADWDRAAASTETALVEDRNFHGTSPELATTLRPHLGATAEAARAVIAALRELSVAETLDGFDRAGFRTAIGRLDHELYAFHRAALAEEDRLLGIRIGDFRASLRLGFALAALSVLISGLLAFWLAADIARRVRRISVATRAVASGDMSARVGNAGTDELGELAKSFDAMTDDIGGLTAEVRRRAEELQRVNDNLEQRVLERTRELRERNDAFRLILDNAHDGMLTVALDGTMSTERSATVERWFGVPKANATFSDYLGEGNETLAAELRLGLDEIAADILPIELTLDQMPQKMVRGERHLRLSYRPIEEAGRVTRLLVVISDVTSEIENRKAAARQEEILRIFHACQRDRLGFLDFFVDAREIVEKVSGGERRHAEIARLVHTLKGNCALFGVFSVSGLCHDIETNMAENGSVLGTPDKERLGSAWAELSKTVSQILGDEQATGVEVGDHEYAAIVDSIARGAPRRDILAAIARWKLEPTERRLARFAERARSIAERLGKTVSVSVESNDLRLCAETWAPVWSVLSHVLRNALDHGIEAPAERATKGKPSEGKLHLRTVHDGSRFFIEVSDDGRGIPWDVIAERARSRGLPFATRNDLVEAVFADGVSSRQEVTDLSGRGIGMAAVREACVALGGTVEIESEPGVGTTIRCSFPDRMMGGKALATVATRPLTRSLAPAS